MPRLALTISSRLLLATLLLAAQMLVLAHASEHELSGHTDSCLTCLQVSHYKAAAPVASALPAALADAPPLADLALSRLPAVRPDEVRVRGPPNLQTR